MPRGIYKRKPFTKEHRLNMSIAFKGRHLSLEHKKKISEWQKINHPDGFQKGYTPWIKGKHHSIESKIKMSLSHKGKYRGENSPHWIKDRTLLKKDSEQRPYDTQYKYWTRMVKNRDNWKCKINNKDCSGEIEAHHILRWNDFPELRYKVNNGITLCLFHHPRKKVAEQKLIPFFQDLLLINEAEVFGL